MRGEREQGKAAPPSTPSSSPSDSAPSDSAQPTTMQAYLIGRLAGVSPTWKRLTWPGVRKLNMKFTRPIVTMALQRAWEERVEVVASTPYPLLHSICTAIQKEAGHGQSDEDERR